MNSEGTQPYIFRSFWFKILTKYAGIFSPAWRLLPIHFLNPSRESFLDLIAVIFLLFCVWLCCPFCSQGDLISNLFLKALIYMELLVRYMKNMVPKCWPCRRCFSPICFTLSYGYIYQCFPLWFLDLVSGWNNLKNQIILLPKAWPQKGAKESPACCPWLSGRTDPHSAPTLCPVAAPPCALLATLLLLWSHVPAMCSPHGQPVPSTHCAFHVGPSPFAAKSITVSTLSLLQCALGSRLRQCNKWGNSHMGKSFQRKPESHAAVLW